MNCENELTVDVTNIKTAYDLQLVLKEKLAFPNFYGENWDAFWDAITGPIDMPEKLTLIGWAQLEKTLPRDASIMKECLIEYNEYYPNSQCEYLFM
ncbi:barstar family protein [Peribacillus kribbensis]|uniref:barstar family protein n=1 Tax=Peribacillus kribbensis TaxID=356658 RepID=UPI0004032C46|nr:barstar family protein [Peribacillus kribbensis]